MASDLATDTGTAWLRRMCWELAAIYPVGETKLFALGWLSLLGRQRAAVTRSGRCIYERRGRIPRSPGDLRRPPRLSIMDPVSVASHFPHGSRRDGRGTASSGADYSCAAICMRRNQHGDPCCHHVDAVMVAATAAAAVTRLGSIIQRKRRAPLALLRAGFGAISVKCDDGPPGFLYGGSEAGSCVWFSF